MQTEIDHNVVSGGSVGCAVAARLAEQPGACVSVVGAGPSDGDIRVKVPFGLVNLMRPNTRNCRHKTVPMVAVGGREFAVLRTKMPGGSGSINSMAGFPSRGVTRDAVPDTIRARASTAYHPVAAATLGGSLYAHGAVNGTENLWVADAGVMPRSTSAHTNAPSMMIGWQIGGHPANAAERTAA